MKTKKLQRYPLFLPKLRQIPGTRPSYKCVRIPMFIWLLRGWDL